MTVDSFRFVPRLIARYYKMTRTEPELPIPWTPLARPLAACRFALVTSGGLYHKGHEPPFDLQREEREPAWGDPSFRTLPADLPQGALGVAHHHINTAGVLRDVNVLLPLDRFRELVVAGVVGSLARHHYSFMGYQGYPPDTRPWRDQFGPEVARRMAAEGVDAVFLTTA